ncbi:MAG: MerR family transcriptional regulator [Lactimicrobium sp.]|uniref:helix-turn-helix domain-containing protein n=1 Tax=Lactimicrobium sp. TaxID=2563780 RepID=UPI002F3579E6
MISTKNDQKGLTDPQGNSCTFDSREKMLSVHEVCEAAGITRKTLFYYDKIGLVKPANHKGKQNGKLYRASVLKELAEIKHYQNAGLTLKEIKILLHQPSHEEETEILLHVRTRLLETRDRIDKQVNELDALIIRVSEMGEKSDEIH